MPLAPPFIVSLVIVRSLSIYTNGDMAVPLFASRLARGEWNIEDHYSSYYGAIPRNKRMLCRVASSRRYSLSGLFVEQVGDDSIGIQAGDGVSYVW